MATMFCFLYTGCTLVRLSRAYAAAMRPYVNYFDHLLPLESIQSHFPGLYTTVQQTHHEVFLRRTRHHDMLQCHNTDGQNWRGLMASLAEGKDRSFNKITGN